MSPLALAFAPTPAKPPSSRPRAPAAQPDGRVRVAVRIKPSPAELDPDETCVSFEGSRVTVKAVEEEPRGAQTPKRPVTPGRTVTPGRAPRTPTAARTPGGAAPRTPSSRLPAPRTPGGRTPGPAEAPKTFSYDAVCGPDCEQDELFAQAQPLVDAALHGYNACVLAYGQTGSGKTYTMIGEQADPGIVPRAVDHVWDVIEASHDTEWHVCLTYVELYNDQFRDLLGARPADGARLLPIELEESRRKQSAITLREERASHGGPPITYLSGSETFNTPVRSRDELHALLAQGHAARTVGCTRLNERSSRSHAVITLALESREGGASRARRGKLHLVDLAGSESLVGEKEALHISHETRAINSALTALCDVMQTLSKNARRAQGSAPQMVPYRNHKLTRLLADSLGGNSTTLMVAAVQTVAEHARQTLGTLKFAARARDITTKARANGDGGANDAQLEALRARVAELQGRLASRELEIDKLEGLNAEREARRSLALREQIDGLEQAMRDERAQLRRSLDEQRAAQQRRATEGSYAAAMASAEMQRDEALGRAGADCDALQMEPEAWKAYARHVRCKTI